MHGLVAYNRCVAESLVSATSATLCFLCRAADFLSRVWTATELGEAAASDSEADEAGSFPATSAAAQGANPANGNGAASGATGGKAGGGEEDVASSKPAKKQRRWTAEHRKNLSEAIKAKWREPAYRQKIIAHMRDPSCQDKRVESRRVRPAGCSVP